MPLEGEYVPSPSSQVAEQVRRYEATDGREANTMKGLPIIVLTSRGAKSGKIRKIPLMRVEHDGDYAAVASMGGAPKHPVWYYNLVAHPRVELQDGADRREYVARQVSGEEKAQWWERCVAAFPDYADYQRRTDREIPVFVLEPVTSDQSSAAS
ncbi:MAG TPA: nitroreductase family deazaflavin-dependent oxidoreductase [Segeticoccus sp.]|uniref:nitroreductase family deazaflavin-dependent oxidoreductase n=1 Tax=Segeticoccus sp. TaxID=2706531 RepID=UPI002D80E253|nr:nitroreductase family deazaflavin-dependent oxidoreductase [Segeticoccus sp.]HET8601632.1 nitroreductase family deazaflavin-dependent oxidoreductase [Segeticoccus sp.]